MEEQNSGLTDEEIIRGVMDRNETVITRFVRDYHGRLYRLCFQYMKSEDDASDALQEVFATVLEKMGNFRGESKLSTWLYSLTVFTCIGILRKKKAKSETSYDENFTQSEDPDYLLNKWSHRDFSDLENTVEKQLLSREAGERILLEIDNLPVDYRTIFILKELEGLSIEEIRQTVPISVSAVKTRLHRARIYLRNRLVEYFHELKTEDGR